jgi:hypothetical protein
VFERSHRPVRTVLLRSLPQFASAGALRQKQEIMTRDYHAHENKHFKDWWKGCKEDKQRNMRSQGREWRTEDKRTSKQKQLK